MANFMDYLKNASNEMANIARQQQADQARAQLEAVRQAQIEEAKRQRAEREAEIARKQAEEEAKVRKAQAEADAKRAEAEAKAMKNIKDKFSTAKNWLTSEDYNKSVPGVAADIAKQVGTGVNNAAKYITVDAPAVATDALTTNLQNNLQRNYVGAIDEFGQAQYDEVMNPNYTPVKNTNYGDIFRNSALNDIYGNIDEALDNDLRGTRIGEFTEGVAQQIPSALAGNFIAPGASLGLMGVSAFGSSGQQALDQGADPSRAALYGLANAAVELGTENISDGIPGVNMKGGIMPLLGEGLEEFAGGVIDPYTEIALGNKNIVDATQEALSKENLKSALEQGVSGALSAGVMNAGQMMLTNPQGVADRVTGNNDYKRAINDINSQLEIAEQAVALNPNDVDAQMQRDNLLASRTMAQRTFATPENLNSDDSVTRNAARQANMDIIEDTARTSGAKLSPSEVRNIASIANKVGARVEFTSEPINGTDGFQDANGVLQINANAKDPVMTIFAHELTHATQGSRQYQQLHDTLVDMAKSGEISVDKLDGLASNPNLTEQQKYDETVATLAQEVFGNSDAIQNLANRNGSLIDRAIQTAKDFMSGNNSVTKAERAMQRAIKNADTRNLTSSNAYTRGDFPFADAVGETINVKNIGEHQSKLPYAVQEMANKLLKTNGSEEAVAKVLKKNGSQTPNYPDSAEYKRLMPQITEFIQSAKGRGVDSIKYENGQFVEVLKEKKSSKNKTEPVTEKTAEQKDAEKKARIEKFLKEQEALEKARTSKETKPAFNFDAAVAKAKEQGKYKDLGEANTVFDVDTSLSKEAQKSLEKEQREIKKEEEAKKKEEKVQKEAAEKAERKGQRADVKMLKSQFQYIYGLNNNGNTYNKHDLTATTVMDKINEQLEKAGMTYEELQERMMREAMGSKVAEVDANDPWAEQLENAKEELRFLKEKYNADILDEEINEFTDIDDAIDEIEFLREDSGADELSPEEYDKLFEEYKNAKFPNRASANEETAVPTEEPVSAEEQKETKIPDEQNLYDTLISPGVQETLRMSLGGPRQDTRSISDSDNAALQAAYNQIVDNVNAGDLYPTNAPLEAIYGQDAVRDSIFGPRNMSIEDPAVQQALMNTLPSAKETVTPEAAEPATETVAPTESVEESEPISVNDYVTDGDSIAEVIDMEDGQLTLRYENGVTETVDDNGLWSKTEAPTQAETQQIKEPQQSESKANAYKVGDKVSVNGNSGQVATVYSNGAVFVKFDKSDVNGLVVQPEDFDTVINSTATSPVKKKAKAPKAPTSTEQSQMVEHFKPNGDSIRVVTYPNGKTGVTQLSAKTASSQDLGMVSEERLNELLKDYNLTQRPGTTEQKKPKPAPVVEKAKDGEVKVNETELKDVSKDMSSDDPNVKEAAKETLKKDVEALTDGSEAGKKAASASVDEFGDAIDEIRDRKEELRKTNETQTNKYNTSDKTKSIQKEQKKSGAKEESHEFVSDVDAETTAEEYYQKFGHDAIYEGYKNRKNSRNKLVSMYDISVVATWIDHNNDIRNQYMKENGITRKGERTYLDKDGNRLKKDSDQYARLQMIDQQELDMANKLSELSSYAGSALHIVQSVLKNISPTTKRNMFNIEIDKLNRRIEKMFKKQLKKGTVKLIDHLSDEEWDAYYNAETDQARKAAMDAIEKRVGQAIPATWGDRRRALRYLNMLFNPATHVRNTGGNGMMQQLTDWKNTNAYILDKLGKPMLERMAKKGGKEYVSSYHDANGKAVTVSSTADRGLLDYWDNYRKTQIEGMFDAERKYSNGAGSSFDKYRNYFHKEGSKANIPGRIADRLVKWNSDWLQREDDFFTNPRFRKEAARITKAEGWELKDGKLVKDGKEISDTTLMNISKRAMDEAKETTFHDINEFAQAINRIGNINAASDIVVGGIVPFTTTPFNIAKRVYEYSPVGLAINAVTGYNKVCNGEMSANTYLNNLAKGLAGTQVAALGWFLASAGLLVGHKKEEWQEQAYKEDVGLEQDYSLAIPKDFRWGKNNQNLEDIKAFYSIDWGGPATSVILLGAQAYEELNNKSEEEYGTGLDALVNKADDYVNIASGILAPVVDATVLSSFQGALDNYYYDKKNGGDGFTGMAKGIVENYLGQFTPTLGGKINNTIDPIKRSTYSDNSLGSFWRQQVKKIPFADEAYALAHDGEHYLEPSINVKGEEERQEGETLASRALLNLFSPGNWTTNKATETDYELLRLYEDTMDADILPTSIKKVEGKDLTPKARTSVNKDYGKAYADEAKSYLSSQSYANSDNKHRTGLLKKVQNHNKANAEANYYNEAGLDGDSLLGPKDITANFLKERGMDNWRAYETFSITNDLDKNGDSITNSGALRKRIVYQNQGVWDDIVADIKAHKDESDYAYKTYGLNKTVVGWSEADAMREWDDLLNISNTGELNLLDENTPKGSGKTNKELSTGKGTGGKRSSGRSGRTSSTAKDADFELFEKILKGEIKATKSAVSKIATSLKSLDAKTYDEIMSKHKQMMNELELYGM